MDFITENIAIGNLKDALNQEALISSGFQSFLACCRHMPPKAIPGILYGMLDVEDGTEWTDANKQQAIDFITWGITRGKVLVYSDFGYTRAPDAVFYYLESTGMAPGEILRLIQQKHPTSRLNALARPPATGTTGKAAAPARTRLQVPPPQAPFLSIVTTTFNRKEKVRACLDALMENTPQPFEAIVVDNGSKDGTVEYLRDWKDRITLLKANHNYGKGKAANAGFSLARGEWIAYFDSDILVPPGWLEATLKDYTDDAGWTSLQYQGMPVENPRAYEELVSGGMMFMPRRVMERIGLFTEDWIFGYDDLDYIRRSKEQGFAPRLSRADEPKIVHLGADDDEAYKAWKETNRAEHVPVSIAGPMPPVDILMVRYHLPDMEEACIHSVHEKTDWFYRLTVEDNYEKKENLSRVWNRFIEASPCEYVCLLNNDTLVGNAWLSPMMKAMMAHPEIAVAGPTTNASSTPQEAIKASTVPEFFKKAGLFKGRNAGKIEDAEITGFCYLLRKTAWRQSEGFSEEFYHFGQDTDFNIRTRYAGNRTVWVKDSAVFHYGGAAGKAAEKRGEMDMMEQRQIAHALLAR